MKTTIFSFTRKGAVLCERLAEFLTPVERCSRYDQNGEPVPQTEDIETLAGKAFRTGDALVFIGASGIAVRSIAPHLRSKAADPAVLVLDDNGRFVIPILSGHLGGANRLASVIAEKIGAQAVITTATDGNGVFAADVWAKEKGLYIREAEYIKYVSAALLRGEKIGFACDYPVDGDLPQFFTDGAAESGIVISDSPEKRPFHRSLVLSPKRYVLGIGCRKCVAGDILEEEILAALNSLGITPFLLAAVATIDIKADEPAINGFCEKYGLDAAYYSAEELSSAQGIFSPSDFVKRIVGTDNVCERAAVLAGNGGTLILKKRAGRGVTTAVVKTEWRCSF